MNSAVPSLAQLVLQGPACKFEPAAVEEGPASIQVGDPQQDWSRVHGLLESPVAVQDRQFKDGSLLGLAGFLRFAPPQMVNQGHASEASQRILYEGLGVLLRIVEQAILRREKERRVDGGQDRGRRAGLPASHEGR